MAVAMSRLSAPSARLMAATSAPEPGAPVVSENELAELASATSHDLDAIERGQGSDETADGDSRLGYEFVPTLQDLGSASRSCEP